MLEPNNAVIEIVIDAEMVITGQASGSGEGDIHNLGDDVRFGIVFLNTFKQQKVVVIMGSTGAMVLQGGVLAVVGLGFTPMVRQWRVVKLPWVLAVLPGSTLRHQWRR